MKIFLFVIFGCYDVLRVFILFFSGGLVDDVVVFGVELWDFGVKVIVIGLGK